ncbi:MAG: alpha/beta hydrolase [Rectinema sp.]|nr:alpha/beta hydrolase [Rectinema sp.]
MESGFITVNGLSLYFTAAGNGTPILYVHGNTGSARWWSKVMDIPGCRTIAIDMPNFGASSSMEGVADIFAYAGVITGFMESMGLRAAVLVGHSLGGCVAQALAITHPELVRALILVDSGAPSGLLTPKERHPIIELMRTNRAVLEQALRAVVPTLKDEAFFQSLVDDATKMAPHAWIGHAEALSKFDIRGRTRIYEGPVLVLRGTLDPIITQEMAAETAAAYPHSILEVLEGVGHSVIVEQPERFMEILGRFVASL